MQSVLRLMFFNLKYLGFWVLYFITARLCFLIYYFKAATTLEFSELLSIVGYGLRLDLSISGYLVVIPFLLISLSVFFLQKSLQVLHKIYSYVIVLVLNTLLIIDLFLYSYWNIRLDTTFLRYLNTPDLMFASVSTAEIVLFLALIGIFTFVSIKIINHFFYKPTNEEGKAPVWGAVFMLLLMGLLIFPIRGGLQTIPINQSNVYFSSKMFANHAALNYAWNFMHALTKIVDANENPYLAYKPEDANAIYKSLKEDLVEKDTILSDVLRIEKPNVILIIWEGFTAKVVGPLGGDETITPNFNRLSEQGILFNNFYANGDRTDKGLVALLSGYYPQPKNSIIKIPVKSKNLSLLSQSMKSLGYENSFYYGGDLNFGNMNTYLSGKGIDQIYGSEIFESKDWNSKWGVHDHVLFDRVEAHFKEQPQQPFFKTILTLTSHEPYEFPGDYKFGKDTELNKFKSSMAYTDQSVSDFVTYAKTQPWWDNTLIIITADHGHPLPKTPDQNFNAPSRFQIPMLWLGGAVMETGTVNKNLGSQVDLSFTLLDLLNGEKERFKFGTHLFNSNKKRFVHYVFHQGFGTIDNSGFMVYDFISEDAVQANGQNIEELKAMGKAILQTTYQDFLQK